MMRTLPDVPEESDVNEVEGLDEGEPDAAGVKSKKLEADALALTDHELRAKFAYAVSAAVGSAEPWQNFTIAAQSIVRPDFLAGMYVGTGPFKASGTVEHKAYDMSLSSRSVGADARYFFHKIDGLSLEANLGYASWNGQISLHGSDDQDLAPSDKLTSSFQASGLTAATSAAITWMWTNGLFLEWTMVGAEFSKILTDDYSRDSSLIRQAVRRNIEGGRFFGLVDVRVGFYF